MRIAYLTVDEVNEDLALRLAEEYGMTVCPQSLRDPPPDGQFDAVLLDWDYWPAEQRWEVLAGLLAGCEPVVVAVHGYQLDEKREEILRQNGVTVFRRLDLAVLGALREMVNQIQNGSAPGGRPGEEPN
jgi:hypothetical protein